MKVNWSIVATAGGIVAYLLVVLVYWARKRRKR